MESYQSELARIKTVLKANPKGMTVTDISKKIHLNRNSVAKYLDILLISGRVDMQPFGPAKVYFPSTRVPVSALLDFSIDSIGVLSRDLRFIQVNNTLLEFLGASRGALIGKHIDTVAKKQLRLPELAARAQAALDGEESTLESRITFRKKDVFLRIRHVPTTFDDGEPGVTVILENITDRKQLEDKMRGALEEWETTFNAISDMIFIQDDTYTVLRANKSLLSFLKLRPEDCIGKKCYELVHGTEKNHEDCPCVRVHRTKKPAVSRIDEPRFGVTLEVSASPIFGPKGVVSGSVHIMKIVSDPAKKKQ